MNESTSVASTQDRSSEWRPALRPQIEMEVIEGEAVVLDPAHERVHHLNEVATFILGCCRANRTASEIVDAVADEYEVDARTAASDTTELLSRMCDLRVII